MLLFGVIGSVLPGRQDFRKIEDCGAFAQPELLSLPYATVA